jgi:hypothetical protein
MDFETFKASICADAPPDGVNGALQALWFDAKGDWEEAHRRAQSQDDATGAWAHAYLHRVEGDLANAGYWYRRANKPAATTPLSEEWEEIAAALLG